MANSKDYRFELESYIGNGRNEDYRKIANNTYAVRTTDLFGDVFGVQYHNTVIFAVREDGSYFFNNGGYFTVTTKKRINDILIEKVGFPFSIYQKSFKWYLSGYAGGFSYDTALHFGRAAVDVNNSIYSFELSDCWAMPLNKLRKVKK